MGVKNAAERCCKECKHFDTSADIYTARSLPCMLPHEYFKWTYENRDGNTVWMCASKNFEIPAEDGIREDIPGKETPEEPKKKRGRPKVDKA